MRRDVVCFFVLIDNCTPGLLGRTAGSFRLVIVKTQLSFGNATPEGDATRHGSRSSSQERMPWRLQSFLVGSHRGCHDGTVALGGVLAECLVSKAATAAAAAVEFRLEGSLAVHDHVGRMMFVL